MRGGAWDRPYGHCEMAAHPYRGDGLTATLRGQRDYQVSSFRLREVTVFFLCSFSSLLSAFIFLFFCLSLPVLWARLLAAPLSAGRGRVIPPPSAYACSICN